MIDNVPCNTIKKDLVKAWKTLRVVCFIVFPYLVASEGRFERLITFCPQETHNRYSCFKLDLDLYGFRLKGAIFLFR